MTWVTQPSVNDGLGAGSGVGHTVGTVASGSCIEWTGTPKVVSQNYERHDQLSFRMGSRREVSGRSCVGGGLGFLQNQAARGHSRLGWEVGAEERAALEHGKGLDGEDL